MFPANTKILVVDDMKTMRMVMKKTLKALGFENVTEADDGETAWPLIQQSASSGEGFQLILSDWNMPKVQGIELLRRVRSDDKTKNTVFIMVTAESEKGQVKEAAQLGVDQYVIKPFTPDSVKEKLEFVYNKKNAA